MKENQSETLWNEEMRKMWSGRHCREVREARLR
jgi:hypothetical protein